MPRLAICLPLLALFLPACATDLIEGDDPFECSDGADNDRDGMFDCNDQDCFSSPDCGSDDDDDSHPGDDDDVIGDDDDVVPPGCEDSDGDGLEDDFEEVLGTDPEAEDSDEDEWIDGEEWDLFTDPTTKNDFPYMGGWAHNPYPVDLAGGPAVIGEVLRDFRLEDQFYQSVGLYTFYGHVIQIMHSADGCGGSQCLATGAEDEYQAYIDQGYMHIVVLGTGPANDASWEVARARGLTMPVLDDLAHEVGPDFGNNNVWPWRILIGRDMTVRWMGLEFPPSEVLEAALAEPWPDVERPKNPCD